MTDDPTPLGDALRAVTDDLVGGQQRSGSVWDGGLANRWGEIVGPMLHDCTLPGSLRYGVLTIHANDPAAASLVRPSRSVLDLEAASVIKRMKDKAFARGVKREDLRAGAELLGLPLEQHVTNVIGFLREQADSLGLRGQL